MMDLFDLVGATDACRFSPYCWRIKLALTIMGLPFRTVPVRLTDKALLSFSGQDKVPVLRDGSHVVSDSWRIAVDLADRYPDRPNLFGSSPVGMALTEFVRHWTDRVVHPALLPHMVMPIYERLDPVDQPYFRTSREARFGRPLETVAADAGTGRSDVVKHLEPARAQLRHRDFLGGPAPTFADCILFGTLQWARVMMPGDLLDPGDPVHAWRERMLDIGQGLGRATPAAR